MICSVDGHPIEEARGWMEHSKRGKVKTYTCIAHYDAQKAEEYQRTGVLTTLLLTRAMLDHNDKKRRMGLGYDDPLPPGALREWFDTFCADSARVHTAMKLWEREVWFGGAHPECDGAYTLDTDCYFRSYRGKLRPRGSLQGFMEALPYTGCTATVGDRTYMTCASAGRMMVQVEDAKSRVTMILDEDSPTARGGIQGIDATADAAIGLILHAILDWKGGRIDFQRSNARIG